MVYSCLVGFGRCLFFLLGLKVEGGKNLPQEGPVIIAANHVSNWDPILVALACRRPVHFMGKAELFKIPLLGKLFIRLNAFPVNRGAADRKAIKQALTILQEGQVLGIFPEGARRRRGQEMKFHAGVALLALKSGAPVLPVACLGSNRKLPLGWFRPLVVRVGNIIPFEEYQGQKASSLLMEQMSNDILTKINSLLSN